MIKSSTGYIIRIEPNQKKFGEMNGICSGKDPVRKKPCPQNGVKTEEAGWSSRQVLQKKKIEKKFIFL